jgi:multiple sugar transport system substrate-binding protein
MSIGSSAGAGYQCPEKGNDGKYPFEVGIAPIPQVDPEHPQMISQGPSLCMFKKASEQEMAAAWLFAKFLSTDVQLQASLSMNNGYTSAINTVTSNAKYQQFLAMADSNQFLQATVINKTLEWQNNFYTSDAFFGSSQAREEVGVLMQTCIGIKDSNIESEFNKAWTKLHNRYDK